MDAAAGGASELPRLGLLPAVERPRPGATRTRDGAYVAVDAPGAPKARKCGARGQVKGLLFHPLLTALPFAQWPHVWLPPGQQGGRRQRLFRVEAEHSDEPGTFSIIEGEYMDKTLPGMRAQLKQVRKCAELLVEVGRSRPPTLAPVLLTAACTVATQVNREVREGDLGDGKMVGGGEHLHLGHIQEYVPDQQVLSNSERKRKRGSVADQHSATAMATPAFDHFRGDPYCLI